MHSREFSLSLSLIYVRSLETILGSLAKEAYVMRYIYWRNINKFISHYIVCSHAYGICI